MSVSTEEHGKDEDVLKGFLLRKATLKLIQEKWNAWKKDSQNVCYKRRKILNQNPSSGITKPEKIVSKMKTRVGCNEEGINIETESELVRNYRKKEIGKSFHGNNMPLAYMSLSTKIGVNLPLLAEFSDEISSNKKMVSKTNSINSGDEISGSQIDSYRDKGSKNNPTKCFHSELSINSKNIVEPSYNNNEYTESKRNQKDELITGTKLNNEAIQPNSISTNPLVNGGEMCQFDDNSKRSVQSLIKSLILAQKISNLSESEKEGPEENIHLGRVHNGLPEVKMQGENKAKTSERQEFSKHVSRKQIPTLGNTEEKGQRKVDLENDKFLYINESSMMSENTLQGQRSNQRVKTNSLKEQSNRVSKLNINTGENKSKNEFQINKTEENTLKFIMPGEDSGRETKHVDDRLIRRNVKMNKKDISEIKSCVSSTNQNGTAAGISKNSCIETLNKKAVHDTQGLENNRTQQIQLNELDPKGKQLNHREIFQEFSSRKRNPSRGHIKKYIILKKQTKNSCSLSDNIIKRKNIIKRTTYTDAQRKAMVIPASKPSRRLNFNIKLVNPLLKDQIRNVDIKISRRNIDEGTIPKDPKNNLSRLSPKSSNTKNFYKKGAGVVPKNTQLDNKISINTINETGFKESIEPHRNSCSSKMSDEKVGLKSQSKELVEDFQKAKGNYKIGYENTKDTSITSDSVRKNPESDSRPLGLSIQKNNYIFPSVASLSNNNICSKRSLKAPKSIINDGGSSTNDFLKSNRNIPKQLSTIGNVLLPVKPVSLDKTSADEIINGTLKSSLTCSLDKTASPDVSNPTFSIRKMHIDAKFKKAILIQVSWYVEEQSVIRYTQADLIRTKEMAKYPISYKVKGPKTTKSTLNKNEQQTNQHSEKHSKNLNSQNQNCNFTRDDEYFKLLQQRTETTTINNIVKASNIKELPFRTIDCIVNVVNKIEEDKKYSDFDLKLNQIPISITASKEDVIEKFKLISEEKEQSKLLINPKSKLLATHSIRWPRKKIANDNQTAMLSTYNFNELYKKYGIIRLSDKPSVIRYFQKNFQELSQTSKKLTELLKHQKRLLNAY